MKHNFFLILIVILSTNSVFSQSMESSTKTKQFKENVIERIIDSSHFKVTERILDINLLGEDKSEYDYSLNIQSALKISVQYLMGTANGVKILHAGKLLSGANPVKQWSLRNPTDGVYLLQLSLLDKTPSVIRSKIRILIYQRND